MAGDWIKLHRKMLTSAVMQHDGLCHLWVYCLVRANWQDRNILLPGSTRQINIKRGQFITGRRSLHSELYPERDSDGRKIKRETPPPSESTLWRRLKNLELGGQISLKSEQHYTIVTVCNYSRYQDLPDTNEPTVDQQWTNSEPTVDQQWTNSEHGVRREEGKKGRRGRRAPTRFVEPSEEEVRAYCQERGNSVDPVKFHAHYRANGWVQGRTGKPIVDWKAAVITWERSEGRFDKPETPQVFDGGFAITNEKFLIARERELAKQRKESGK
jgi:hypothetical protein